MPSTNTQQIEKIAPSEKSEIGPAALIEIRRHRLRLIGADGVRQDTTDYIDPDSVKAEILQARRLCTAHGWPVIDVTRRSIEETAAAIIALVNERRGLAARNTD